MAALTPTNTPHRHVLGDLVVRHYTVTGTNGDTLVVPQQSILHVSFTPTTNISGGVTVSAGTALATSTLTFATAGAFTADVMVFSRKG